MWASLLDPEKVAPCLPGATLTGIEDRTFAGTASATMSVAVTSAPDGTAVSVVTDLLVTGRPAQFGRGLISEVSGRIIDEFAQCLATRLAPAEAEEVTSTETAAKPHLRAVPDDPLDLLDTAGVPVLKWVLPVAAGLLVVVALVRRLRGRHR